MFYLNTYAHFSWVLQAWLRDLLSVEGEEHTGLASEISELQKENASMEAHVTKLRHDVSSMEVALKVEQKVSWWWILYRLKLPGLQLQSFLKLVYWVMRKLGIVE